MNDTKKSKLWVYAVVLFTSAFIVLLFTAYSQIKLNENLNRYKNQVINKETENKEVQQNFLSAQEMNDKLNNEIENLKEENKSLEASIDILEDENNNISGKLNALDQEYGNFLAALNLYMNDDFVNCVEALNIISAGNSELTGNEHYISFSKVVKTKAGKELYDEGYASYRKRDYEEAAKKLISSYEYAPNEVFSDECLYYIAYSQFYLNNGGAAIDYMNKLIDNHPDSNLIKSAKRFINKHSK